MNRTAAIAIALIVSATAYALPRHILITINEAVYAEAPKPEKAHKAALKYIDAPSIFGHTDGCRTNAAGDVYGMTLHWAEQWTKHADKLDSPTKLDQLNVKLAESGITMTPCDDYTAALADAGLYRIYVPALPDDATNTTTTTTGNTVASNTTTTAQSTTTTTTARE